MTEATQTCGKCGGKKTIRKVIFPNTHKEVPCPDCQKEKLIQESKTNGKKSPNDVHTKLVSIAVLRSMAREMGKK